MLLLSGSQRVGIQDTKPEEAEDELKVNGWTCPKVSSGSTLKGKHQM